MAYSKRLVFDLPLKYITPLNINADFYKAN